jgi:hypothetical protein
VLLGADCTLVNAKGLTPTDIILKQQDKGIEDIALKLMSKKGLGIKMMSPNKLDKLIDKRIKMPRSSLATNASNVA